MKNFPYPPLVLAQVALGLLTSPVQAESNTSPVQQGDHNDRVEDVKDADALALEELERVRDSINAELLANDLSAALAKKAFDRECRQASSSSSRRCRDLAGEVNSAIGRYARLKGESGLADVKYLEVSAPLDEEMAALTYELSFVVGESGDPIAARPSVFSIGGIADATPFLFADTPLTEAMETNPYQDLAAIVAEEQAFIQEILASGPGPKSAEVADIPVLYSESARKKRQLIAFLKKQTKVWFALAPLEAARPTSLSAAHRPSFPPPRRVKVGSPARRTQASSTARRSAAPRRTGISLRPDGRRQ